MIRKSWMAIALALLAAPLVAQSQVQPQPQPQPQAEGAPPAADMDPNTLSYSVGYLYGSQLKDMGYDFNLERVTTGLKDAVNGTGPAVPQDKMKATLQSMEADLRKKQMEEFKKVAKKNKEEGEKFLAENAKKKGVHVLPSGLQYRVIEEGDGKSPTLDDTVVVHYRGSLPNGFEFDSSFARGTPATFQVKSVIKGWQEALTLMKKGAKWQIFVPPELGYGETGKRPIGPNQTLVFDLELVDIKPPGAAPDSGN